MRRSVPLTDSGSLVAVAAEGEAGWFLIAVDARLEELDRASFASPAAAERAAVAWLRRRHPEAPSGWRR
jgi:hypothetical protein